MLLNRLYFTSNLLPFIRCKVPIIANPLSPDEMKKRNAQHTNNINKWIKKHVIRSSSTFHTEWFYQLSKHTNQSIMIHCTIGDEAE